MLRRDSPSVSSQLVGGSGPVSRRRFIELIAAAGAGSLVLPLAACSDDSTGGGGDGGASGDSTESSVAASDASTAPASAFPDGVMAGDPRPDGSVIWTRIPADVGEVDLAWEVSEDDTFATVVAGGTATAAPDRDGTVHVTVSELDADRWYHYRFVGPEGASPVGRLRTAPTADTEPERLRFAWCSCQQINDSLYVAQRAMANEPDLDFFMHLGDYIYVNDVETLTLDDYREVYHRFKANPMLQELQAQVPLVAMFDDGEFYNGVDSTAEPARLQAALDAWFETFPILPVEGEANRAYRSFAWGVLADIFMLDVRQYRDPAIESSDTAEPEGAEMLAEGRTTLGATQREWLLDGLAGSRTAWRFLGNPYNMAMGRIIDRDPGPPRAEGVLPGAGSYFPNEAWDDYSAERSQILGAIAEDGITDVVSVSGHTHVWIAASMQPDPDDPESPTVAYDFTCGSLTADPDLLGVEGSDPDTERAKYRALEDVGLEINPHMSYLNFVDQGYGVVEVTPERAVFEYMIVDPFDESAQPRVGARFVIERGATEMTAERFSDVER